MPIFARRLLTALIVVLIYGSASWLGVHTDSLFVSRLYTVAVIAMIGYIPGYRIRSIYLSNVHTAWYEHIFGCILLSLSLTLLIVAYLRVLGKPGNTLDLITILCVIILIVGGAELLWRNYR